MLSICPWKWFGKSPPAGALGTPWRCWSAAPLGFRAGGRQRVASHRCNGQPWWWWIGWGEKNGKWWVLWNKHSRTSSYMKMSIYLYIYIIYIIILYIYYNIIYIIYIFTHTLYIYTCIYELSGVQESHSLEGERPAQCGAWQSPTEHQSFPTEYPLSDTPIAYPFALLVIYPYVPVDCITVAPVFYLVCPCYIPLQPLNHHFCWLNSSVFLLRLGKTI